MLFTFELNEINYYDSKVFILEQIIKLYKNCLIILNLNDSESIFEDSEKIEARIIRFQKFILAIYSLTASINLSIDNLENRAKKDNINLDDFFMDNTVNEALQDIEKKDNEARILNQKILESKNSEDKLKNLDVLQNILESVKEEWTNITYQNYNKYRIEELRRRENEILEKELLQKERLHDKKLENIRTQVNELIREVNVMEKRVDYEDEGVKMVEYKINRYKDNISKYQEKVDKYQEKVDKYEKRLKRHLSSDNINKITLYRKKLINAMRKLKEGYESLKFWFNAVM